MNIVIRNQFVFPRPMIRARYWQYPAFRDTLIYRGQHYNALRAQCFGEEKQGNAVVICPSKPITLSGFCRDPAELMNLYSMGVQDAAAKLGELREFMA